MSSRAPFFQVPNFVFALGLDKHELPVLMALLKFGAKCFPSYKKLAQMVGLGITSVKRALASLRERSFISWTSGGYNTSNYYVVHLKVMQAAAEGLAVSQTSILDSKVVDPFSDIPHAIPDELHGASFWEIDSASDLLSSITGSKR